MVGRAEILVALFTLLSMHLALRTDGHRGWRAGLPCLAFLAACSKESAVLGLPIFTAVVVMASPGSMGRRVRSALSMLAWVAPGIVVYAILRSRALEGLPAPPVYFTDNPMVALAPVDRLGTSLAIIWRYVQLHAWPQPLSPDYSYNAIPLQSIAQAPSILGLIVLLIIGYGAIRGAVRTMDRPRPAGLAALALIWFGIGLVALSNALFVLSTVFAERLVYLPGMGWFLLIGVAVSACLRGVENRRTGAGRSAWPVPATWIVAGATVLFVIVSVSMSRTQTRVWHSNASLFAHAVRVQPESFRTWDGHGRALMEAGDLPGAQAAFQRSIAIWPQFDRSLGSLLSIYLDTGQADSALVTSARLLALDPHNAKAYFAQAKIALDRGDTERAFEMANRGLQSAPDYEPLHYVAGQVYETRGDAVAALLSYDVVLRAQPDLTNLKMRMAPLLVQAGHWDRAVTFYRELTALHTDWNLDNAYAWSLLQQHRASSGTGDGSNGSGTGSVATSRDVGNDGDTGDTGDVGNVGDTGDPPATLREALGYAERAVSSSPPAMARFPRDTRGRILWELGRHDDALAAFRELTREYPEESKYRETAERYAALLP